ncbi:MAG: membrane lipoprotein lipid attachment site-containing protein [Muribaculaceae bacterium]|nr:membrane lipoprotein lipid attachment site-containing protein [Muribaculaceae bacterium]
MKKILFAAIAVTMLTSCWTNMQDTTGGSYRDRPEMNDPNGRPTPPPDDRYGQWNGNNNGNNGRYTTDPRGNSGSYYNNNSRYANRPALGSYVNSLPSRNVRTITVRNEQLFLVNGVYYKVVSTGSGMNRTVRYQVVGYQQ